MPKFHIAILKYLQNNKFYPRLLIGSGELFPLESRIFHGISLGLILLAAAYVPYNLYAGLYVGSLSALFICLFYSYQYYYSRFRRRKHNSTLFGLIGLLVFGLNYFTNSGIHGSTDLIWPAYLLLVLTISPYQQHLTWLVIYIVWFMVIHIIEYYYPNLVQYPFTIGKDQFIDRITAFPLPVVSMYVIIKFIRRSYDKERQATEEKAHAVAISKEELTKINNEKNKLMSIVSHDLRAPLGNVQSYLQLLAANEIDESERPRLEKALLKSTSGALVMLSNLLHWSRSQMEGINLQLTTLNVNSILQDTIEMEKIYAQEKQINLSSEIPAGIKIVADVDMLQLVVRNLISNAIKFTAPEGKIHVTAIEAGKMCKINVSDNGSGISADKKNQIFSIKASPSYGTANEKGVGLGLVLCKEFMERQGGTIGFESTEGIGSDFYVYLPLADD